MRVNSSRLNWGIFFILLGALPLAANAGVLDRDLTGRLVELWPLVIIAIGIGVMLRLSPAHYLGGALIAASIGLVAGGALASGGGNGLPLGCVSTSSNATTVNASGQFANGGQLDAELSCVALTVDSQPGNGWAVAAGSDGSRQPQIGQSASELRLVSQQPGVFASGARLPWHITLPQAGPLDLSLTVNAASGTVSLPATTVSSLQTTLNASDVDFELGAASAVDSFSQTLNASSATLVLPAGANINGSITLNAASLDLCVAPTLGIEINLSETLASNNFAAAGLTQLNQHWSAPVGTAGSGVLNLSLTSNVSSINLDRSGGCQ